MEAVLQTIQQLPAWVLWLIFGAENVLIMLGVLVWGNRLQRKPATQMFAYNPRQWSIALLTCILNTIVTYAGYWLWQQGYIRIGTSFSLRACTDAVFLFLAMDLLMYLFHYGIHKTFAYQLIHSLHHAATDPEPIDLFILHPVETLSFGALWLLLLVAFPLNIYGIIIYLIINVIFGMTGHLGMEPLPEKLRGWPVFRYLGTSTFHHRHHRNEVCNFGFYTSIWDRLFRTFDPRP
ncbi:sterol desaturase family protein [Chitinophaga nivalis]|uniref:Sterol desaturase family protein n=1 Tax=Chitinophaga nivalis TaxID=2991709 RepID=A0ABT3IWE2_9BACT|nr:sterol desaturase family protein [Chitinophaga nivalis]MCW3462035.1 sterol desaturase family protein [Chitinophaga nivalis]MCW3488273.1 sterol desaturase family protein [Chitinophaga nivalis]